MGKIEYVCWQVLPQIPLSKKKKKHNAKTGGKSVIEQDNSENICLPLGVSSKAGIFS